MSHNNPTTTNWQHPSKKPILTGDRVHLWRAQLDLSACQIESLATLLSNDEIARANRFRFEIHRQRFIVARGILRLLLGHYLEIAPNNIKFQYSDRGKPFLAGSKQDSSLQFNISHSQAYALYGFTYNHPIGVDLEYTRNTPDAVKIARRFFSQEESKLIEEASDEERAIKFCQLWTAKEAYLKAVGTGLSGSLSSVKISLERDREPKLLAIEQDPSSAANWSLYPCFPTPDFLAAVAIAAPIARHQINYWHWHPNLFPITII